MELKTLGKVRVLCDIVTPCFCRTDECNSVYTIARKGEILDILSIRGDDFLVAHPRTTKGFVISRAEYEFIE